MNRPTRQLANLLEKIATKESRAGGRTGKRLKRWKKWAKHYEALAAAAPAQS